MINNPDLRVIFSSAWPENSLEQALRADPEYLAASITSSLVPQADDASADSTGGLGRSDSEVVARLG